MLKQMRGALKGVMAWFIIALLILAFALWGVPELRSFTQKAPLRVGKASYSAQTIQQEFNRQMTQRRNQSEGGYTREDAIADGLPDFVVNSLSNRAVLQLEAAKMGLVMPRSLVREYLQEEEAFKNPATGNFDRLTLESILQANNLSVRQFEELLKDDMLRTQLINSVAAGSTAPNRFASALLMRQFEQRQIGYLTVTDDMAGVPAEPTPDDLKTYYEENQSAFMAPEYRSFTGVTLAYEDFREGLEAPEEELRKLYDARKALVYEKPETRTIYQLLYETEGEAQAAAAALQQGTPFEALAEQRGISLANATLTEAQQRDVVDPQVGEALFAEGLQEGNVVGPVKGLFGWTVAQIAGLTPPETQEFEDVRADLEREFLEQDTRRRVFEIIDELEEARDTGASLEAAAQQAGVEPKKYGPVDSFSFAPGGAIVPNIAGEMLGEAFELDEGDESMAEELARGGYFLVQVDAITPPQLLPYEDVEAEVEQRWRAEERRARIADAAAQVVDAIKDGRSFAEAAEPFNRAVLTDVIGRNANSDALSPALVERIFAADKNAVVVGDAGSGSAQTVVEIRDIGFNRAAIGPGEETGFRQFVNYQLNQEYLEAYVNALREDYGVKVDNDAVAQIFSDTP